MRDDGGIVRSIVFVLLLAFPAVAAGQTMQGIPRSPIGPTTASGDRIPEDIYIMPWVAAGVVYDDNVFFARNGLRQDDVFLRVTPGIQASYQSTPFTIVGNYRFDSEVYNKFTQLNTASQRQFGTVDIRVRPSASVTFANTAGYAQTNTPYELNLLTAAQTARFRTERYFESPSAEYRLDQLTKLSGSYGYSKDIFAGEVEINSHIFNLGLDRRVGAHDTLGPAYVGRHFTFGGNLNSGLTGFIGGDPSNVTSHALQMAWAHEFSADTRLDVRAGPRFTNGSLDSRPEAFVGLRRRIQNGELSLGYTSAITTIIGTVGATRTDSLMIMATYEPVKHLTFTVSPTASWIANSAFDSTVYTAYLEAAYQFNKYVTAKGSAYFSYQEGNFLPTGGATVNDVVIARNVYWLRLEFTYPTRWDYGD